MRGTAEEDERVPLDHLRIEDGTDVMQRGLECGATRRRPRDVV